jgi:hypothetical protein
MPSLWLYEITKEGSVVRSVVAPRLAPKAPILASRRSGRLAGVSAVEVEGRTEQLGRGQLEIRRSSRTPDDSWPRAQGEADGPPPMGLGSLNLPADLDRAHGIPA